MKKFFVYIGAIFLAGNVLAEKITVAATEYPNAQILEFIKPILAKKGYELKIQRYNSYNDPVIATAVWTGYGGKSPNYELLHNEVDANFFQHKVYLDQYNFVNNSKLISVGSVFFVPFGIYSANAINGRNSVAMFNNARVAIPDNSIGETRAIKLLAANKVISFDMKNPTPGLDDVESNPYKITIYRVDSSVAPEMLKNRTIDYAVMNVGNATLSGISSKNLMYTESVSANYSNVLVSNSSESNTAKIQVLKSVLQSNEVKQFIANKYGSAVIAAF